MKDITKSKNISPYNIPADLETGDYPDPAQLSFITDISNRVLWLQGEVDETWLEYARHIMLWNREDAGIPVEKRKPIKLIFFTCGGSLDINNSLVDIITLSKTPVYGYNIGYAASAGCFIYMSCHKRYALKNAYFVIHNGSGEFAGTYEQVAAAMDNYQEQIQELGNFILNHSTIPVDVLNENIANDWYLNSTKAVEYGFCDGIIDDIDQLL